MNTKFKFGRAKITFHLLQLTLYKFSKATLIIIYKKCSQP